MYGLALALAPLRLIVKHEAHDVQEGRLRIGSGVEPDFMDTIRGNLLGRD